MSKHNSYEVNLNSHDTPCFSEEVSDFTYIYVHLLKATDSSMKLTGLQWGHAMTYCMRIKGTRLYSVATCAI